MCTVRPATCSGTRRRVTRTRISTSARSDFIVTQPPFSMPRSSASWGEISQNSSGCSSPSQDRLRLAIDPEPNVSVSR